MPPMRILYCPTDPEMYMVVVSIHQGTHRCPICNEPTEMLEARGDQLMRAAGILEDVVRDIREHNPETTA